MKHNIRQRVINEYGLPVVKIEQVTGELGSGIFDKNGKEIFEGDLVRDDDGRIYPVTFEDGSLWAGDMDIQKWFEVIGHVEDTK